MTASADDFAQWDAAYVLGALSPQERRSYEAHLATCRTCQVAVSEIAGIPGLLAQVAPEDAAIWSAAPVGEEPPPDTLLPAMIGRIRTRRRQVLSVLAAVAAAVVLLLGGIAIGRQLFPALPEGPQRVAFRAVAETPITAVVDLEPVPEGTRIQLECQWGKEHVDYGPQAAQYAIVVVDTAGQARAIKQWDVKPNKVMRPEAVAPQRIGKIAEIQIRHVPDQTTVLRAPLR